MKYKLGLTLAMASVAGFAFVGPGQAGDEFKNKYGDANETITCNEFGDTLAYHGPDTMWPPNHKMQPVDFVATNVDGGSVTLTVTHEIEDLGLGTGDGGQNVDVQYGDSAEASDSGYVAGDGTAIQEMLLRSERSGRGEGRTYDLTAVAEFDGLPRLCTLEIDVLVPHDMRGGANWK